MRLNGWKRIGIVASVIWAVSIGIVGLYTDDYATLRHRACINMTTEDPLKQLESCYQNLIKLRPDAVQEKWLGFLVSALVPIPIGWLLTYMVIWVVRWIRRGFNPA